ncbi:MAG: GNAT family N-acetyltransferase, partial [Anaerolineales bacterium]|nr:GNAT family N-acetyltransferase [Anaerolineales bacterium]
YWGQGIGTFLLDWGAQRAHKALARVPDDVRVAVLLGINAAHEPSHALMEGWGMTMTRAMYRMAIDLDATQHQCEPTLPDDLRLTTLAEYGADRLPEVYRAYNDSFRDHWGHVESPEAEGLEQFRHRTEDPDFDPALWFLLVDKASDEIAAVALCMPKSEEDPTIGHVDLLGVRRPWRRRGLGLLLLQQVFCTFVQRSGFRQVALNVDAQSLTGATRLYERAGMRVERT